MRTLDVKSAVILCGDSFNIVRTSFHSLNRSRPWKQVEGGFSVEFGCYDPHSAKTPSAYHVKSITRYAGGVFILSAYTAFGVSHFSKEDVRCVSHKETSG